MLRAVAGPVALALGLIVTAAGLVLLRAGESWGAYLYIAATALFALGAYLQWRQIQLQAARRAEWLAAEREESMRQLRELFGQAKASGEQGSDARD